MGRKAIRLVVLNQKASDDGWLTALELLVSSMKWAVGVGGLRSPQGQAGRSRSRPVYRL